MGSRGDQSTSYKFSDNQLPRVDGHGDYGSYSNGILLWMNLITLPTLKHEPTVAGHRHTEAKSARKSNFTGSIYKQGCVDLILEFRDEALIFDKTNQQDTKAWEFFDFSGRKYLKVEHFISGFQRRLNWISSLSSDDKPKGYVLHCQKNLTYHDKNVVSAASGSYDISPISGTLTNIYQSSAPSHSTCLERSGERQSQKKTSDRNRENGRGGNKGCRKHGSNH